MTPKELRSRLDFAVEIAWRSGRAALAHYQTGIAAETKPDASPVTAADRAAERCARDLIARRFPDDDILGEEEGETGSGAALRWILDPIDGTRTFVRGVPLFGVLVALESEGRAILGVMDFPALGESVYAASGLGCWWNGRRAAVSSVSRLEDALVVTTDTRALERSTRAGGWASLSARAGMCRTWGDCYGYALVATGRAEAMLDPELSVWDAAALGPIIEEAGGVFTDWEGRAGHLVGSAIATNAALARDVRRLLRGSP
ncbi:inositol monophosphatase family protein [soil metagenome]